MKLLFFSIQLIFMIGCKNNPENNVLNHNKEVLKHQICKEDYDSSLLKYAYTFVPTTINLSKSISNQLDSFLLHIDTNCLRQQKEFKVFVAIILMKLYYYHLKCCNQGYDLQSMETNGAKIIIVEFKKIAGYQNQHLEMLNSGTIVDFIKSDLELRGNTHIKELLENIEKEVHRINIINP